MGKKETYEYIHDNPSIEFRPIDYTNDPLVIAAHRQITAINSCIQIDLTGQATAESIGRKFFSGIGGQADFMRGAVLSPRGKNHPRHPVHGEQGHRLQDHPLCRRKEQGSPWAEATCTTLFRSTASLTFTERTSGKEPWNSLPLPIPSSEPWLIDEAKTA